MEYKYEVEKIKSLVSKDVWEYLAAYKCIIAGGALTSVFSSKDVNDLDIYFSDIESFTDFVYEVLTGFNGIRVIHIADKSVTCVDTETGQQIQFIIYKFFKGEQEIFNDFDFTINMGAISCETNAITLHPDFLKDVAQRRLAVNHNTAYPIISVLRVQKYLERGYTISKNEMLKLLLSLSQLDIKSWEELKDHVGGMYGLDMDSVFGIKEEFSIYKALDVLSKLDVSKESYKGLNYDLEFPNILPNLVKRLGLDKNAVCGDTRLFKCVTTDKDDNVCSYYMPSFKYPDVGGIVNSESGIYFCTGSEIFRHYYFNKTACIIELKQEVPNVGTASRLSKEKVLKGDVEVVGKYSKLEFLSSFFFTDNNEDKDTASDDIFENPF